MAFWTDGQLQDPKRGYRFLVTVGNMPDGATWYAKSVKKPSFTINPVEHKFLNHTFYYPGRITWNDVTVELVDPVSPDAAINTVALIKASGYMPPDATDPYGTTIAKNLATQAVNSFEIAQIDSVGNRLETWSLQNPWISGVEFGDLNYDSDELTSITLTIRYDWASIKTLEKSNTNAVGAEGTSVTSLDEFWQRGTSGS